MNLDHTRPHVQLTASPAARDAPSAHGPRVCLVEWLGSRAPRLADLLPAALVDPGGWSVTERRDGVSAERATVSSPEHALRLPGLADQGSALRDAARLALLAGAPCVDVMLVRVPERELAAPLEGRTIHLVTQLLDRAPSCAVVFPGAGARWGAAPEDRPAWLARLVHEMAPAWRARRQAALFDLAEQAELPSSLFAELAGADAALCRFRGSDLGLAAHGWRSAAAVFAALLASGAPGTGLVGCRVPLGAGRRSARSWIPELTLRRVVEASPSSTPALPSAEILIQEDGASGLVLSEGSLRAPTGEWPLSTLWATGRIHDALIEAAERFVFRAATPSEAALLSAALHRALRPWVERGLLVGPGGAGAPLVSTLAEATARPPALTSTLEAMLRPWQRRITVRLTLPPEGSPRTELS